MHGPNSPGNIATQDPVVGGSSHFLPFLDLPASERSQLYARSRVVVLPLSPSALLERNAAMVRYAAARISLVWARADSSLVLGGPC